MVTEKKLHLSFWDYTWPVIAVIAATLYMIVSYEHPFEKPFLSITEIVILLITAIALYAFVQYLSYRWKAFVEFGKKYTPYFFWSNVIFIVVVIFEDKIFELLVFMYGTVHFLLGLMWAASFARIRTKEDRFVQNMYFFPVLACLYEVLFVAFLYMAMRIAIKWYLML